MSNKYYLYLDDERNPSDSVTYMNLRAKDPKIYITEVWEIARNFQEFVNLIWDKGMPAFVSFDHDLAEEHYDPRTWVKGYEYAEPTGFDCAQWLVEYCLDNEIIFPDYAVHSFNGPGTDNIKGLIENFKKYQDELTH